MRGTASGTLTVWALLVVGPVFAQQQSSQSGGGGGDTPSAVIPPPIYTSGGSYYSSSTAVEGGLRGSAELVRAAGEYNYNTAAGMAAAADAESKGIANGAAALNNYFTLKAMNDNYQMRHRGPRTNGQQAAQISRITAPKRLSVYQLDPVTGEINWPAILHARAFGSYRASLDELFARRQKENSGIGTPTYEEIVDATDQFQSELKGNIDHMTPAEYVVAKRFLSSLAYEALFAPSIETSGVGAAN